MQPNKLFPLIITDKLAQTRAYYTEQLGAELSFGGDTYMQIRFGGEDGPELCFMTPDAAPALGQLPKFGGDGLVVSIPTDSADLTHARVEKLGAKIGAPPSDKPWGWRSFTAIDPNGVVLDFFHVIDKPQSATA
jgi:uncharacterized glyoxalase superfamily protein PhnB